MADLAQIKPRGTPHFCRPALVRAAMAILLVAGLQISAADTGIAQWFRTYPWLGFVALLVWLVLAHVIWDRQRWNLLWRFRALLGTGQPQDAAPGS